MLLATGVPSEEVSVFVPSMGIFSILRNIPGARPEGSEAVAVGGATVLPVVMGDTE